MPRVLVDAENVRRSAWPNVSRERLLELVRDWAKTHGHEALVVYDGPAPEETGDAVGTAGETADEWLIRETGRLSEAGEPFWLVTSDRGLRVAAAGPERTIGGGSFLRELLSGR